MKKTALLSCASAIVLAASLASTPAQAFDNTYWTWDSHVMETVYGPGLFSSPSVIIARTECESLRPSLA